MATKKLTRAEIIRRIEKHYRLSPAQLGWSTASLRIVLETYETQATVG